MVNWFQKMIVPNMMFNMNSKPACSLISFYLFKYMYENTKVTRTCIN